MKKTELKVRATVANGGDTWEVRLSNGFDRSILVRAFDRADRAIADDLAADMNDVLATNGTKV